MIYRFENFVLDENAYTITQAGRDPLSIEPKVLALILLLVRHRGQALSRDFLHRSLWPTVIVGDGSLNRLMTEARKILGDNAASPKIIRTLRTRGYRFDAEVTLTGSETQGGESQHIIEHAKDALLVAIERGSHDLKTHVEEFTRACYVALERAHPDSLSETWPEPANLAAQPFSADQPAAM